MSRALGILLLLLGVAACDEMNHQKRDDSYEQTDLFPDHKSLQAPPEGTLAQDDPALTAALENRPAISLALLERGRQRYGIYCALCHDAAGYGRGIIPSRGFPEPPSFHDARLRNAPSAYFVDVITHGHGVMYAYADRVTPADRWAIAAYIRALQLSQNTPKDALSPVDLAALGAQP